MADSHAGNQASIRGPAQFIGLTIRVFGLDGVMLLGCFPIVFFPFNAESWYIATGNMALVFAASRMKLPTSQIPRRLISLFNPLILPPTRKQMHRDDYRPWPY